MVNNWNGTSNVDQIGVYRSGFWFVDSNGSGAWETTDAVYSFGMAGDLPAVGNWNGGGRRRIGILRNGVWILDTHGSNAYEVNDQVGLFGLPGDKPVAGHW